MIIKKYRGRSTSNAQLLRQSARPFIRAILLALEARDKASFANQPHRKTRTIFKHVRSHTGYRDLQSMGNEAADRAAKWMALDTQSGPDDIDLLRYDLPYVLHTHDGTPLHGDIRRSIKEILTEDIWDKWSQQTKRGTIAKEHRTQLQQLITINHKSLTTIDIKFMLVHYTRATHKSGTGDERKPLECERCLSEMENTVEHILTCPVNEEITKKRDAEITAALGVENITRKTALAKALSPAADTAAPLLYKTHLKGKEWQVLLNSIILHLHETDQSENNDGKDPENALEEQKRDQDKGTQERIDKNRKEALKRLEATRIRNDALLLNEREKTNVEQAQEQEDEHVFEEQNEQGQKGLPKQYMHDTVEHSNKRARFNIPKPSEEVKNKKQDLSAFRRYQDTQEVRDRWAEQQEGKTQKRPKQKKRNNKVKTKGTI
jgi:hypothetical protein